MNRQEERVPYRMEQSGALPTEARGAVIMLHGRGGSPQDILSLAGYFERDDVLFLAPEAPGGEWYPFRFMEPIDRNEPGITLSMQAIDDARARLAQHGIGAEGTAILGFSQGACLALEYAARHAQRYGGIIGLSGGLIGPDGTPRDYHGSLEGTPVFLGCSDVDAHIPVHRVHEAETVLARMGAEVTKRIYRGMAHTVNEDEIEHVRQFLKSMTATS